jgi:hypothetical protein
MHPPAIYLHGSKFVQTRRIHLLLGVLSITAILHAEDLTPAHPITDADTYIPGSLEVAPFVPPAPVEPTRPLTDAVVTTVLVDENQKTTILQRGQASMAPDWIVPQPTPPETPPIQPTFPRRQIVTIQMGGTVYDHRVSVVHWQHPVTKEPYEAVIGFDLGLIAPINSFIRGGVTHHTMLFTSNTDTDSPSAQRAAAHGHPIEVPEIEPDAYRITEGDPDDSAGLSPLLALHELYLTEKPRLEKLRADLAVRNAEAKAWADAHPTPPETPVFWFKPHRNSRYLTEQDKANQRKAAEQRAQQKRAEHP